MPRRAICRLLPDWPEALLPGRLTPGMVRSSAAMSLAGGRLAMSSAVMVEVPSACRAICEAGAARQQGGNGERQRARRTDTGWGHDLDRLAGQRGLWQRA
ncbi:hypothetical protein G6F45_013995 [Rhizopus arrhizus]|nr:hypothetical protein G6F45_013995 [Rhizopus arrhizus]